MINGDKTFGVISLLADQIVISLAIFGSIWWFQNRDQISRLLDSVEETTDRLDEANDAFDNSGVKKILGLF